MIAIVAIKHINEELDRLEKTGVIQRVEYAKQAVPMMCIKGRYKKFGV